MRIKTLDLIEKHSTKKDLIKYLVENKKELIKQKKSLPIHSEIEATKLYEGKTAEGLIFKFEPLKEYNEKIFNMYKNDDINQHSIGLQYVKIDLAVSDPDQKEEYEIWERYVDKIINREEAERAGFFWAVKEAKIFENSAVLWGANKLTPVLSKEMDGDRLIVNAVGNVTNFMDSHMDVMLEGSYTKSINDKGNSIPVLEGHMHTLSAKIGKTLDVYTQVLSMSELYDKAKLKTENKPRQKSFYELIANK